jgi:galactose mutarotase-like enzyme
MRRPWSVDSVERGHVDMSLRADAATREAFPFAFSIRARFCVCPGALEIRAVIHNDDDRAMPFSAGWHPYLPTPEPPLKDATLVDIPATAAGRYDETFTRIAEWHSPLPFPLRPSHPRFCDTLHRTGAGAVRVVWPDGFGVALEAYDDGAAMPFWQLHTEPDKPYICVEPWSSPPNALNSGEHLTVLAPGASRIMAFAIRREEI